MQALVHFAVGVSAALLVFTVVDWPVRREVLTIFLSGFFGTVPDGHHMFKEAGMDGPAAAWKAFHRSPFADLFWFHGFIDSIETGRKNLELAASMGILLVFVLGYYRYNDWSFG